jgi:hypothetical protein
MTTDEENPQNPDEGAQQNLPQAAGSVPAERGPDGKFLPGNHAAGEHLFKPGQSGNPNGRPSTKKFTDKIRQALEKNDGEMLRAMVNVACQRALKGDFRYFKEIIDRMDGKLTDHVAIETEQHLREFTEHERREAERLTDILIHLPPDWSSENEGAMDQLQAVLQPPRFPK